ncbi:MAG: amidophosphoribosyltransferase [Bacteroidetes bacterium]|nr:MAG: amidophosphoribosyltransferase [Bacteroidota bacterium]
MKKILDSIGQLLFPKLCVCCESYLTHQDGAVCDLCYLTLPKFELYKLEDNPLAKKFWGRINTEFVTAYLSLRNSNDVQRILHEIKYKSNKNLGLEMGRALGRCLLNTKKFQRIDYIIPIPLHPKRQNVRGYNQSNLLADGMSEIMSIKVITDAVVRMKYNSSQTKKKRYERFINSQEIFKVLKPKSLEGKHVLLIDDVITTGATMEACGEALLEVENLKISIAALAVAT